MSVCAWIHIYVLARTHTYTHNIHIYICKWERLKGREMGVRIKEVKCLYKRRHRTLKQYITSLFCGRRNSKTAKRRTKLHVECFFFKSWVQFLPLSTFLSSIFLCKRQVKLIAVKTCISLPLKPWHFSLNQRSLICRDVNGRTGEFSIQFVVFSYKRWPSCLLGQRLGVWSLPPFFAVSIKTSSRQVLGSIKWTTLIPL